MKMSLIRSVKAISERVPILFLVGLLSVAFLANSKAQPYTIHTTTLSAYGGVHPKLLLDPATIATLRSNLAAPPAGTRWGALLSQALSRADIDIDTAPPLATYDDGSGNGQSWEVNNGLNMADLSMAYVLTKGTPPATESYWFEAEEAASLQGPMAVVGDATASGQNCIATPASTPMNGGDTVTPPSAVYDFSVAGTRNYAVWARTYAAATSNDSLWFNLDGATDTNAGTGPTYGSWVWIRLGTFNLTEGNHLLNITYREGGLKIDKFLVTSDTAFTPSGLGGEQHWIEAESFTRNNPNLTVHNDDYIALGQQYLAADPAMIPSQYTLPAAGTMPDAQASIVVAGGSYDIWMRGKCFSAGNDSFYFGLDGGSYAYDSLGSVYNTWEWFKVASNVTLPAGSHTLNLSNRESGARFDRFLVLPTTIPPAPAPSDPNKYLMAALRWANASRSYATWGKNADGSNDGTDLTAAHQLFGLAVLYDWAYADLSATDRQNIASTLITRGTKMYQAASGTNTPAVPAAYWRNEWLQNHMWINETGLAAAGLALYGDAIDPGVLPWLQDGVTRFSNTMNDLAADGANHEGVYYWEYGMEWVFKYMDIAKKLYGADMWGTAWFQNAAAYRLYFTTGFNSWYDPATRLCASRVDFNDDDRTEGGDYLLRRLASEYGDPVAQWMAGKMDDVGIVSSPSPWLNLVWYSSSVAETSPATAGWAPFNHFSDKDFTVSRSAWDGNESVVGYECGPFMGHQVQAANTTSPYIDWGGSHVHPAANNFCIFGAGDWLIRNDGYTYLKLTAQSNTLLVNGAGQLGEGGEWFNAAPAKAENPSIDATVSFSTPSLDYLVGNAATAYPAADGLTQFKRHLLYVKPDVLIVADDIALSAAKPLKLRFFPEQQTATGSAGNYATTGAHAKLAFTLLTPSATAAGTESVSMNDRNNDPAFTRLAFSLTPSGGGSAASWDNAVAMAWAPLAGTPRTVAAITDDATAWKFRVTSAGVQAQQTAVIVKATDQARLLTVVEAESAALASQVGAYADSGASGGSYVTTKPGTAANNPDTLTSPSAAYPFTVPSAGSYALWIRVLATDTGSDSMWYAINPTGSTVYTNEGFGSYGSWTWTKLGTFTLPAGSNTFAYKYRELNCKFDELIVTDDATFVPNGKY